MNIAKDSFYFVNGSHWEPGQICPITISPSIVYGIRMDENRCFYAQYLLIPVCLLESRCTPLLDLRSFDTFSASPSHDDRINLPSIYCTILENSSSFCCQFSKAWVAEVSICSISTVTSSVICILEANSCHLISPQGPKP